MAAERRGVVGRVCRSWLVRIPFINGLSAFIYLQEQAILYTTPSFWNIFHIYHFTPIAHLDFMLSKCTTGEIHIKLLLRRTGFVDGAPITLSQTIAFVDRVFWHIGPTSRRWKSFALSTEHPYVFARVQYHCSMLLADSLTSFDISYVYLPGYASIQDDPDADQIPFQSADWFNGQLEQVEHLYLFCYPVRWESFGVLTRLRVVHLVDFSTPLSLDSSILITLLSPNSSLEELRLGTVDVTEFPADVVLACPALRVLDVRFFRCRLVGKILSALIVPNLTDLVVRDVADQLYRLLICPALLSGLVHLELHGKAGDRYSLQHLFAAIPRLRSLNLHHTDSGVFDVYSDWALSRVRFQQANHAAHLRCLFLGHVDLSKLVALVDMLHQSVNSDSSRPGLAMLRLEKPSERSLAVDENVDCLRFLVPDFAFTGVYERRVSYDTWPPAFAVPSLPVATFPLSSLLAPTIPVVTFVPSSTTT
ncbi:hypothetical protein C8R43DRAFT_1133983 [Mycena crocata]|nr:hypothetical protein C8R43DRAFT_1133983 [Mycena crocata]